MYLLNKGNFKTNTTEKEIHCLQNNAKYHYFGNLSHLGQFSSNCRLSNRNINFLDQWHK